MENTIIIGAGPCGLSAAVELKRAGVDPLIIEKGAIVQSIYDYPTYLIFHSTAERLEIGGIPFVTPNDKPTRLEALNYYRTVAQRHQLRIHTYEKVTEELPRDTKGIPHPTYQLTTTDRHGATQTYECANLIIATGYFDYPNRLNIPGEQLPKVTSYYKEAHPYVGTKVAIVGGNNSAVDAAIDLERAGAEVTVIMRRAEISERVKAWTRPIFESMINKGRIRVLFASHVQEIHPQFIRVSTPDGEIKIENDFVLTLIGYRPDRTFLEKLGVTIDPDTLYPEHDPNTMETNVKGLYIAGVVATGQRANEIFIENGRFHGELIARHIAEKKQ